ncbi:MAG TPA: oxygenase MpaB family protein [Gaiellaceae bacterium]|nr:oxygenase MpaB family protein [Gaiellaceae bacterium]
MSRWLRELQRLDPVRDAQRIVFLDAAVEFPWDTQRALEVAFCKSYAVPSIAELLASTHELTERTQKRYDDTQLLISAFCELGYDTGIGKRALRRMNQIHARFAIANDDFLYVLSTMVFEPIRWNARFGWRPLLELEKLATFYFWREIGRRMAIDDLPDTYDELERYNVEFERERFAYTDAGHRVAVATRDLFLDWFPGLPKPVGRPIVHALLDPPLLDALGLPHPPAAVRRATERAIRLRSSVVRVLPARRKPRLRTLERHRSYPDGYRIESLGPPDARVPLQRSAL